MTTDTAAQGEPSQDQLESAWAEELAARQAPGDDPAATEKATTTDSPTEEQPQGDAAKPAATEAPKTPTLEERFAALEAAHNALKTEHGRDRGRLIALQSTIDTAKAAAKKTDGPTDAQIAAAVEDSEEWKQLQADFPDWAKAFESKMDAKIKAAVEKAQKPGAQVPADAPSQTAPVDQVVQQEVMRREIARVDRKHPNWRETVKTPVFQEWLGNQAPEIRALYTSDDAFDAIEMLNLFEGSKTDTRPVATTARRKAALEVAAVTGKPRQQASAVTPAGDLTPAQEWELEKNRRPQKQRAA